MKKKIWVIGLRSEKNNNEKFDFKIIYVRKCIYFFAVIINIIHSTQFKVYTKLI